MEPYFIPVYLKKSLYSHWVLGFQQLAKFSSLNKEECGISFICIENMIDRWLYCWVNGMCLRIFVLISMILVCGLPSKAETAKSKAQLYHFSTSRGLPSSEIHDIHLDTAGRMWIATDRGVCSYNGYDFLTYGFEDGMGLQTVWKIIEDSLHRLWFVGLKGELYYYDSGRFVSYQHNHKLKSYFPENLLHLKVFVSRHSIYLQFNSSQAVVKICPAKAS